MKRLFLLIMGCGLIGFMGPVGCGGGDEDGGASTEQGAKKAGKKKGGKADAAQLEDEDERPALEGGAGTSGTYSYNPIGKRDPFRSFIAGRQDEEIRSPTPLQRFDIEQLTLVGIVWGIDHPRALIQDPDKISHVVERGTYIGRNWGKVAEITSREIVITEEYQTIEGELVTEQVKMNLPIEDDF
ncbi:MAG: pilus assembly protein PilP [Myxococcota bacterium]|nr:pilus assembly protein PilP [Myxococcota bacterium]